MRNEVELMGIVRPAIAEKPTAYWSERLSKADIMHERLNSFREFLRQPQAEAIDLIGWLEPGGTPEPIPVPNIAGIATLADGTPRGTTPVLGQHTAEVLREHGFSREQIVLIERKVVLGQVGQARLVGVSVTNGLRALVVGGAPHLTYFFPVGSLLNGSVLVDAHVGRQAQHALGDDVAHDLVGAAGDARGRRRHQGLLEHRGERRQLRVGEDAALLHQVHGEGGDVLQLGAVDQLADRGFRPRRLAARQRRHGAEVRVLEALARHVPVGELVAHGLVLEGRAVVQLDLARQLEDVLDADAAGARRSCSARSSAW